MPLQVYRSGGVALNFRNGGSETPEWWLSFSGQVAQNGPEYSKTACLTTSYVDRQSKQEVPVYLFVACLPYSQYTYVEACPDMKQSTWIRCNVHMLKYIKGVPLRIRCDNLKTGVITHPREGEIVLNDQ